MSHLQRKLVVLLFSAALGLYAVGSWAQLKDSHFVITNDNPGYSSSATFFLAAGSAKDATLAEYRRVLTNQVSYGYLIYNPLIALSPSGDMECVFISNIGSNSISAIDLHTQRPLGSFTSSKDNGTHGLGIVAHNGYVYAAFLNSRTLAAFKIASGCKLEYVDNLVAKGLNHGAITGMAAHGNILVVTYGDGSIQSFNVANGTPVSNQDEQNSTGYRDGNLGQPNGVDISEDGHYAIFGDFTGYHTEVEVSDISSGKLTTTVDYGGKKRVNGSLGSADNSEVVWLSPDESLLYVSNTTSGHVTAANFDKRTGKVSRGCTSDVLKGYPKDWYFTFQVATGSVSGNGSPLYVVEQGFHSADAISFIGILNVHQNGGKCKLSESKYSEAQDQGTQVLSSFQAYPPRPF
jgi:6-phosphogluconolactonase (cycloisomerase 2 family)